MEGKPKDQFVKIGKLYSNGEILINLPALRKIILVIMLALREWTEKEIQTELEKLIPSLNEEKV